MNVPNVAEFEARIAIAERERNHLAEELARVMEQRDEAHERFDELKSKFRFTVLSSAVLIVFMFIVSLSVGA